MGQPDVSLIIISLNSLRYLTDCLESIKSAIWRQTTYETLVIDNGSTDGTIEMLESQYPEVILVANGANLGYCKAGNIGASRASGRYLLFLNDDIAIRDDALPSLVEWMDRHPNAGMIGSRLLNADGTDQFSSGRSFTTPAAVLFGRKSLLTRLFPEARWARQYLLSHRVSEREPYTVDWLSAAAMMARRETFERAGGLEESFYYFHEQVFCKRVQNAGYGIYLHPLSRIVHFEGVGSGVRTKRVRRLHIQRFHQAAYRWFCHHHDIGCYNPIRLVIAAGLMCRAGLLMVLETVKPEPDLVASDLRAGRPEGGAAL